MASAEAGMEIKQKARQAVQEIGQIVGTELSAGQKDAIDKVVEDLVIEAMRECEESYGHAARNCCAEDEDRAHKIAREIEQAREALIANLRALR
jgi:hypothetical protein